MGRTALASPAEENGKRWISLGESFKPRHADNVIVSPAGITFRTVSVDNWRYGFGSLGAIIEIPITIEGKQGAVRDLEHERLRSVVRSAKNPAPRRNRNVHTR